MDRTNPDIPSWGYARRAVTATTTVALADRGYTIDCTSGTYDVAVTAAATLGAGFCFGVYNSGSGTVTINPSGAETIRSPAGSAATLALIQGQGVLVLCDGTGFEVVASTGIAPSPGAVISGLTAPRIVTAASATTVETATAVSTDQSLTITNAAGAVVFRAAAQDGVRLLGRAGGSSSFLQSITTAALSASRTFTLPDADTTITGGGTLALGGFTLTVPAAGTVCLLSETQTITGAKTFTEITVISNTGNNFSNPSLNALQVGGAVYARGYATYNDVPGYAAAYGRWSAGFPGAAIILQDTSGGSNHPAFLQYQNNTGAGLFQIDTNASAGSVNVYHTTDSTAVGNGAFICGGGGSFAKQLSSLNLLLTMGTITGAEPVLDSTVNWNAGGVTFTGWKLNVTGTAYAAASRLLDLQIGGASRLSVDPNPGAGQTSLFLYDADNATLERVTVGAADSGGAGFKVLRIPN